MAETLLPGILEESEYICNGGPYCLIWELFNVCVFEITCH